MSIVKDYYRERYSELSEKPGMEREPTFRLRVEMARRVIGTQTKDILEFGCNTGAAVGYFLADGHRVTGVDISDSAIRIAKGRYPMANFITIEKENCLPFPDDSFDVCYCSEVIEHLFDIKGFLSEIHRVLRPEGTFLLTTPFHARIKNILIAALNFDKHFNPLGDHIRFFTPSSLSECLGKSGFIVKKYQGVGRFWPVWKTMFVIATKMAGSTSV